MKDLVTELLNEAAILDKTRLVAKSIGSGIKAAGQFVGDEIRNSNFTENKNRFRLFGKRVAVDAPQRINEKQLTHIFTAMNAHRDQIMNSFKKEREERNSAYGYTGGEWMENPEYLTRVVISDDGKNYSVSLYAKKEGSNRSVYIGGLNVDKKTPNVQL